MYLCVIDTNLPAMAFYQKLGFRYHSKTTLDASLFKEELKGMNRMYLDLEQDEKQKQRQVIEQYLDKH